MTHARNIRRRMGLSLVEVLIAVTLFVLAICPLLGLFQGQARQVGGSKRALLAHETAQEFLQEVTARLYLNRFRDPSALSAEDMGAEDLAPAAVAAFERQVDVSPSPSVPGLWEIRVTVTWTEQKGRRKRSRRLVLAKLVSDPQGGGAPCPEDV